MYSRRTDKTSPVIHILQRGKMDTDPKMSIKSPSTLQVKPTHTEEGVICYPKCHAKAERNIYVNMAEQWSTANFVLVNSK